MRKTLFEALLQTNGMITRIRLIIELSDGKWISIQIVANRLKKSPLAENQRK